jgi:hydrogenase maturation factor
LNLSTGKIFPKILERTVFKHLGAIRNDVLVGPSVGEDAAIIRIGNELLALHCDPISGAYSNIGWIAMNIATNDIATLGVKPCWVLSCLMLPQDSVEETLSNICKQMGEAAEMLGVSIIGGHSEITVGLNHPLVVVSALGAIENGKYVTTSGAKPTNKLILTKSVGIEGTAILATDREQALSGHYGVTFVRRAKNYLNYLSIVNEALISFNYGGVLAMHDPTEGGIAGGLNELADASKTGFRVYENRIAISCETMNICRFFNLDPLRLISSGALLIAASSPTAEGIVQALETNGIAASIIGELVDDVEHRTIVQRNGSEETLPMPASDELWKALV